MTTLQHDLIGAAIVCRNADYPKLASRCEQAAAEIARLEAVNAELVSTVTALLEGLGDYWADQNLDAVNAVHAALARALPQPAEAE